LALKEMGRNSTARQKQARGLVWAEIEVFLSIEPRNLRDTRDRALVAVAYDTMCRREELVSLLVEDVAVAGDGAGSVLIRRSKTDTTGEGATVYLSPLTMRLLTQWIGGGDQGRGDFCQGVGAIKRWHIPHASERNDDFKKGWSVDRTG
jgi:integrase